MKNKIAVMLWLLIITTCLLAISCGKGNGDSYGGSNNNNNTNNNTSGNRISISGMKFGTASLTVKAGTVVTWTNNEYMIHTVTADDNSFTSGDMNYGDSYSHTFTEKGTYPYHCKYHSSMTATVISN